MILVINIVTAIQSTEYYLYIDLPSDYRQQMAVIYHLKCTPYNSQREIPQREVNKHGNN